MPDRRQLLVAGVSLPLAFAAGTLAEDGVADPTAVKFERVFPLCGCPPDVREKLHPILEHFVDTFGGVVLEGPNRNPRCCFWFELIGQANPGESGWFIVHHGGRSICYATDVKQMELAVDRLVEIAKLENGVKLLPVGITTSFPSRTV